MSARYQRTHVPVSHVQNGCPYRGPIPEAPHDRCPECAAWLPKAAGRNARSHKPNTIGAYGWTDTYADGSTVQVPPV